MISSLLACTALESFVPAIAANFFDVSVKVKVVIISLSPQFNSIERRKDNMNNFKVAADGGGIVGNTTGIMVVGNAAETIAYINWDD